MAGQTELASAGAVDSKARSGAPRFAIYCGEGLYVRSLARQQGGRISIGRDQARGYTRETAIAALHVVRRAGRGAWLVPHPGKLVREVAA